MESADPAANMTFALLVVFIMRKPAILALEFADPGSVRRRCASSLPNASFLLHLQHPDLRKGPWSANSCAVPKGALCYAEYQLGTGADAPQLLFRGGALGSINIIFVLFFVRDVRLAFCRPAPPTLTAAILGAASVRRGTAISLMLEVHASFQAPAILMVTV